MLLLHCRKPDLVWAMRPPALVARVLNLHINPQLRKKFLRRRFLESII